MIMIQTQRLAIVRLNDKLETWFIKSYFNKKYSFYYWEIKSEWQLGIWESRLV